MMQQVNLLVGELGPKREALTLRQLVVVWSGFAGVLLLISAWQGIGVWQLGSEQADKHSQWQALTQSNEMLRASFDTEPGPELVSEVQELRLRFHSQALLVDAVEGYEALSQRGFSRFLSDLAAQHVDGMTLSRIELHDGGRRILLSGETEAPVNVPLFLQRLSEGDSFRGHRFDEFRLEAQESGLLRFDITGPGRAPSG
jgi:hypothetical protein